MRNLTASRATQTSGDSSSTGEADAESGAGTPSVSSPASQAKPMIEIRAGLGELALIISGRACNDWWPPQARSLHSMLSFDLSCTAEDHVTQIFTTSEDLSHGRVLEPMSTTSFLCFTGAGSHQWKPAARTDSNPPA